MKKLIAPFLILLTVLALVVCALLPYFAAVAQDSITVNHSGFSDMQTVKLDLREEREARPMMGKLALLGNMETVAIDPSQMQMTEDEVFAAVDAAMADYEAAGIFQWFDIVHRSAVANFGVDLNDASNFLMYWTVSYSSPADGTQWLLVDVDDETGKILNIHYAVYESYSMDGVWERNETIMAAFTDIYFAQLGLTPTKEYAESIASGTYYERDGGVTEAYYSFGDAVYGEINIVFIVEGAGGFYIYFPN